VVSGTGKIEISHDTYDVKYGDMIFVPKGTPFSIDGNNLELLVTSSPHWTPEQHKHQDNL
jgi:mannose-6-phosphate isomerase-like protein (cupin superfamily)